MAWYFWMLSAFLDLPDGGQTVDEGLLPKIAAGDQEAFHQLYQSTDRAIYGFILSILKNPQDAEEVMQETYVKIWTSASSYHAQGEAVGLDVHYCQESLLHEIPGAEALVGHRAGGAWRGRDR